jgi:hypothetical protein
MVTNSLCANLHFGREKAANEASGTNAIVVDGLPESTMAISLHLIGN